MYMTLLNLHAVVSNERLSEILQIEGQVLHLLSLHLALNFDDNFLGSKWYIKVYEISKRREPIEI